MQFVLDICVDWFSRACVVAPEIVVLEPRFPVDLSGFLNWLFLFLGCSFVFSQSALLSAFCGRCGTFVLDPRVAVGSAVLELAGLLVVVTILVLIRLVGVGCV